MRIALWGIAAIVFLLPLIAMQVTDEVDWGVGDSVLFGALLAGVGVGIELAMRRTGSKAYRAAVAVALVAAFFLIWLSLGVGIIGRDGDPVNGMYFGVLAVGVIGALIARFRPGGMTCALVATTIAQMLVAVIALLAGFGKETANYPLDILLLTTIFVVLWLVSARLFRRAVEKASVPDTFYPVPK